MKKNVYLIPFILVTSLFFLWGFAHSILDVLNKHFQVVLVITKAHSALIQTVVYGGYFLMALPAGLFIKRYGYRYAIVLGLGLYGLGALLFIPAESYMSFEYFLFCLFVIGCGLTFLETAANPYVTELGDQKNGTQRLNIAQSFNGLGWIAGPLLGGLLVFKDDNAHGQVSLPYTIIGVFVILVGIVFTKIRLPEIKSQTQNDTFNDSKFLWKDKIFVFGVIAQFFYVGAQTGINSFFINYITEINVDISPRNAAIMLSFGGMGLFMVGRFIGSYLMKHFKAYNLLKFFAIGAIFMMLLVILRLPLVSIAAIFVVYLFMSIMFPTIFALSVNGLGENKKQASSYLIMSIVGGAIIPPLMGVLGSKYMSVGFIIPLICFVIVLAFSLYFKENIMKYRNIEE